MKKKIIFLWFLKGYPNYEWNQIANLGRKLDKENYNIQGLNMKEEEGDALT